MNNEKVYYEINYGSIKKILAIFTIILVGLFFLIQTGVIKKKYILKIPYEDKIELYSGKNSVNKYLVAAVIKNESKFMPTVRSDSGAIGLMQIMPETATWIADRMNIKNFQIKDLNEPQTSIKMGCWYLSELSNQFNNNDVLTLMAYNAGPGNTYAWMNEKKWDYSFNNVDDIPYLETRIYVKRVLQDMDRYKRMKEK